MSDTQFIAEPSVYLLARPSINSMGLYDFMIDSGTDWTPDLSATSAESLVEIAGRVCYMSFDNPRPGGNKAYIKHILEVGHGSVLEHANFTLILTGVSRSLTHELIRHRAGFGYSQLSQRYVNESDCSFVVPPELVGDDSLYGILAYRTWSEHVLEARAKYVELSDALFAKLTHIEDKTARRKKAREAARSVLPNCTETKIVVTGNARAWRHFLEMRGSSAADAEIQRLAKAILPILASEAPNIFGDYVVGDDGISTPNRKV